MLQCHRAIRHHAVRVHCARRWVRALCARVLRARAATRRGLAAGPSAWSALNARAIVPACATAVSTLASALVGMAPSAACSTMRLSAPAHHPPPATPSLTVDLEVIYLQQMK